MSGQVSAASGEPYIPGPSSFELPALFAVAGVDITKPMVLVALSVVLISGFFWAAARPAAVVPGRLQFAGEYIYGFVRGLARDNIGSHEFKPFIPILFSFFTFILVNNYFGLIPLLQFPTAARIGFPVALALIAWVLYNGIGIRRHGFYGYLKHTTVPSGVQGPVLGLIVPLEFVSNILVRPLTLALRLFATMFAGHLLLILFSMGADYLFGQGGFYIGAALASGLMFFLISTLELLIMFLQAYVFTLLTSIYVGGALADEH